MSNIDVTEVTELQGKSEHAYALARNAYESARIEADLHSATVKQQDAALAYRSAVAAREVLLGI